MKLYRVLFVVLATCVVYGGASKQSASTFIARLFNGPQQAGQVPDIQAVPKVSVEENAGKLERFLLTNFRPNSGFHGAAVRPMSFDEYDDGVILHGTDSTSGAADDDVYDIMFLLDNSGSIGDDEFLKAKQYLTEIIDLVPITINPENSRIACITFSTEDKIITEFDFLDNSDKSSVIQAINRIQFQNGASTHTTNALERAKALFDASGRRSAKKMLFVATDGQSNGGGDPAIPANQLKNTDRANVQIHVVAVSGNVNRQEVEAIASAPASEHVIYVNTFTEVNRVTEVVRANMAAHMGAWSSYRPSRLSRPSKR